MYSPKSLLIDRVKGFCQINEYSRERHVFLNAFMVKIISKVLLPSLLRITHVKIFLMMDRSILPPVVSTACFISFVLT